MEVPQLVILIPVIHIEKNIFPGLNFNTGAGLQVVTLGFGQTGIISSQSLNPQVEPEVHGNVKHTIPVVPGNILPVPIGAPLICAVITGIVLPFTTKVIFDVFPGVP